ncbi:hypothetical protein DIPPA_34980 [Diplonema papillatum]|nr:hypothetical protein DIPPA_34980 [Diplonema papillatum]|eukprot:gene16850-25836_t
MEYAKRLANEVGESFIALHTDAIEKAAEGKVIPLKKAVRPIVVNAVWSALQACHDRLLLSLPAHMETNDDGYQWLFTLYSPELSASIRKDEPADGAEAALVPCDAKGPFITSGVPAGAINGRDIIKLLVTLSQMHRHLSSANASHHFSHAMRSQSIDGTMHAVVRDDYYTVLWVADCHQSEYNKSFTEQALPAAQVNSLRAMLRFVHDKKLVPEAIASAPPDIDKENVAT